MNNDMNDARLNPSEVRDSDNDSAGNSGNEFPPSGFYFNRQHNDRFIHKVILLLLFMAFGFMISYVQSCNSARILVRDIEKKLDGLEQNLIERDQFIIESMGDIIVQLEIQMRTDMFRLKKDVFSNQMKLLHGSYGMKDEIDRLRSKLEQWELLRGITDERAKGDDWEDVDLAFVTFAEPSAEENEDAAAKEMNCKSDDGRSCSGRCKSDEGSSAERQAVSGWSRLCPWNWFRHP